MSRIRVISAEGVVLVENSASVHDDDARRAHQGLWLAFEECAEMADRMLLGMSAAVDNAFAVARRIDDESPNIAELAAALNLHRDSYVQATGFHDECLAQLAALGAPARRSYDDRAELAELMSNDLWRAVDYVAPRLRAAGYAFEGGVYAIGEAPPVRRAPHVVGV